jgi:hypothetical protein
MTAPKLANLAQMSTTTVGTGPVTLTAATSGFRPFSSAGVTNGDTVIYSIYDISFSAREYGTGVVTFAGPTMQMTRVFGGSTTGAILALSGNSVVSITPRAEDLTNPIFTAPSWAIAIAVLDPAPAVSKTLYEVTGASAPFTITLPSDAATNDAVAVYMRDYTSTTVVTVDAGVGGTIADFGQTHQIGVQHSFFVYRCVAPMSWIVEWDPFTKELRKHTASTQVSVFHGNSLLYVDSTTGAMTITVPSNITDPLPVGFQTEIMRYGANNVTLVADAGVTLDAPASLVLPTVFSRGVLTKIGLNEWTWGHYGGAPPGQRIATTTPVTIGASDEYVFLNLSVPAVATVNLPSAATRGGRSVYIKDASGSSLTYNHSIVANGTDVFEGGLGTYSFYTDFQGQEFIPVQLGSVWTWFVK